MKYINVPSEFKAAGDTGTFSGYASIFGNVDLGGDIMKRGAFKEIVKNADGMVVVLNQHNSRQPLGVAEVKQDDKGLAFDGHLVMEDPMARTALAHMKAKSLNGMSIGFDILPGGAKILESGIREISEAKLWEISPVTFGMNPLAGIESAKSMPEFETIREAERWLREELGLTHGAAKEFVVRFKKALMGARDEPTRDESTQEGDVKGLIEFLVSVK